MVDPELLKKMMLGAFSAPDPEKDKRPARKEVVKTIDLHFEKLYPQHAGLNAGAKLQLQLEAFEQFVQDASKSGLKKVRIITGKGEGVLLKELKKQVNRSPQRRMEMLYDPPYFGNAFNLYI